MFSSPTTAKKKTTNVKPGDRESSRIPLFSCKNLSQKEIKNPNKTFHNPSRLNEES